MTQFLDQYEAPFAYFHQGTFTATAAVTGNIKASKGELSLVSINQKSSAAAVVTLFDNTAASGTVIGVFDPSSQVTTVFYNVAFQTGLSYSIAIATSTVTGPDLTFAYV